MKRFIRVISVLTVSVIILSALSVGVFATKSETKVTYDGNAQKFIFTTGSKESPTDLFESFKDLMPGDKVTQHITVNNDISEKVKIKVYLRSDGADQGYEELLSKLKLTVKQNGESELFKAPADQKAGLSEWKELGLIYSGGKIDLDVTLEVPTDLDDKYQDSWASLTWRFKVEEYPVDIDDPLPIMGDSNNMIKWIVAMTIALVGVSALTIILKKKEN